MGWGSLGQWWWLGPGSLSWKGPHPLCGQLVQPHWGLGNSPSKQKGDSQLLQQENAERGCGIEGKGKSAGSEVPWQAGCPLLLYSPLCSNGGLWQYWQPDRREEEKARVCPAIHFKDGDCAVAELGEGGGTNNPGPRILGGPLLITTIFIKTLMLRQNIDKMTISNQFITKWVQKLLHRRLVEPISIVNCVQFV